MAEKLDQSFGFRLENPGEVIDLLSMKTLQTDIAIIGGGFGAALLARALHKKTLLKIDIFEAANMLGGNHQAIASPFGAMEYGPKVIPAKEEYKKAISVLEDLLGRGIVNATDSNPIKAFEKGEFKTFVGFGDKKPEAIEEWDYYLGPERLKLVDPIFALRRELLTDLPVTQHSQSELTRLETNEGQITSAIINGEIQVLAKAYILFCNPVDSLKFLPQQQVDAKIRQKVSKSKMWTSLSLNVVHKGEVCQEEEPQVFIGPGEVPFVAFGQFHLPRQETGKLVQFSQWLTLVPSEEGEAEELYAHALRELKKLLLKAYPKFYESMEFEKITVSPRSHGRIALKFEKDESFPGFSNLWLGHHSLADIPNLPGAILRASQISEKFIQRFEAASRDLPESSDQPRMLNL